MDSIVIILSTILWAYAVEVLLIGGFLAFLIQKKQKNYKWYKAIPVLMIVIALNENLYLPAIAKANVTFTVHNQAIANFFDLAKNDSLTEFAFSDLLSFWYWFIEAWLAFGVALFLTRETDNTKIKADD